MESDDSGLGSLSGNRPNVPEGYQRLIVPGEKYGTDKGFPWGNDVRAISIGPLSEADAIIIVSPSTGGMTGRTLGTNHQQPQPNLDSGVLVVTARTPFIGYVKGPFKIFSYYDTAVAHAFEVYMWTKVPDYIPPSFLRSTTNAALRIFNV